MTFDQPEGVGLRVISQPRRREACASVLLSAAAVQSTSQRVMPRRLEPADVADVCQQFRSGLKILVANAEGGTRDSDTRIRQCVRFRPVEQFGGGAVIARRQADAQARPQDCRLFGSLLQLFSGLFKATGIVKVFCFRQPADFVSRICLQMPIQHDERFFDGEDRVIGDKIHREFRWGQLSSLSDQRQHGTNIVRSPLKTVQFQQRLNSRQIAAIEP